MSPAHQAIRTAFQKRFDATAAMYNTPVIQHRMREMQKRRVERVAEEAMQHAIAVAAFNAATAEAMRQTRSTNPDVLAAALRRSGVRVVKGQPLLDAA